MYVNSVMIFTSHGRVKPAILQNPTEHDAECELQPGSRGEPFTLIEQNVRERELTPESWCRLAQKKNSLSWVQDWRANRKST